MHSHCALRRGPAHHLGRIAKIERVANVALGERCANVLEPFGQVANLGERRLAGPGEAGPVHAIEPTTKNRVTSELTSFIGVFLSRSVRVGAKQRPQDGSARGELECAKLHSCAAPVQYPPMQWDDLRYVLAVARTGSALRAARSLGVDQTTVLRKLDLLETTLGTSLFERRKSGQTPTPAGKLVAETAERMEKEARGLENTLATRRRIVGGAVRLTTSDGLAARFVTPCMRAFQALYPGVSVELIATDERLDIAAGEADVALRGSSHPEGVGIVAQRMPDILWTITAVPRTPPSAVFPAAARHCVDTKSSVSRAG